MISRVAVSLIICAGDSAPRSGRIGSDKCQQLETDIQRYRKLLEQSLDPQTIEIQSYRKLLALGLDPLTIERIDGVIQELVQPKPAYSLTANRLATSTGFSPRRGRKAAGLLARVTH